MAEEPNIEFVNFPRRYMLFAPKVAILTVPRYEVAGGVPVEVDTSIPHIVRRFYSLSIYIFLPPNVDSFLVTEKMAGRTRYSSGFYFPIVDLILLKGLELITAIKNFR